MNSSKLTRRDLMIEHVIFGLIKTFLLAGLATFLFVSGALLFGFLVAIFTYFYFFYGIFVKQPEETQLYTHSRVKLSNSEQRLFDSERQKRREKIKRARQGKGPTIMISQPSTIVSHYSDMNFNPPDTVSFEETSKFNPTTGLPMIGCVDVNGNPYGSLDSTLNQDFCDEPIIDYDEWNS